jgi:hypothetical protein
MRDISALWRAFHSASSMSLVAGRYNYSIALPRLETQSFNCQKRLMDGPQVGGGLDNFTLTLTNKLSQIPHRPLDRRI